MAGGFGSNSHKSLINDLSTLRIFVATVETGSLTKAGERMNIGSSTVSKHISALEESLSAQLIIRSTQGISITELGRQFFERCRSILKEVENAEDEVSNYQAEARGLLRISCQPAMVASCVVPMLRNYLEKHPNVKVDLDITTMPSDLIASGLDAAIGVSTNLSPDLIVIKLLDNERLYCATPQYIEQHGRPATVSDLKDHNCLIIKNMTNSDSWPMRQPDGTIKNIRINGNFICNDAEAVRAALLEHMGIAHVARISVNDQLEAGNLIELFPNDRVIVNSLCIVVPKRLHLPLKTRSLIDHLKSEFRAIGTL